MRKISAFFMVLILSVCLASCTSDEPSIKVIPGEETTGKFSFLEEQTGEGIGEEDIDAGATAAAEEREGIVYVTPSGTKYHRSTCHHVKENRIEKQLEDAVNEGYTPCKVCFK